MPVQPWIGLDNNALKSLKNALRCQEFRMFVVLKSDGLKDHPIQDRVPGFTRPDVTCVDERVQSAS